MTELRRVFILCFIAVLPIASSSCKKVSPPPATTPAKQDADSTPAPPADLLAKVQVRPFNRVLTPAVGDDDVGSQNDTPRLLADAFQDYHSQFTRLRSKDWYRTSLLFRDRLIALAKDTGLDAASLSRCLEAYAAAPENGTAYVPVGAFAAQYGEEPVWIVLYCWENSGYIIGKDRQHVMTLDTTLSHIYVRVIRMSDAKEVAMTRCK
jgi:hypothetical protein